MLVRKEKTILIVLVLSSLLNLYWLIKPVSENRYEKETILRPVIQSQTKQTRETKQITVPAGMGTINTLQHTSLIGTATNPTLDGGLINAADGLPINLPKAPVITKNNDTKLNAMPSKFNDRWVDADKVKLILEQAAQSGKLGYVLKQSDAYHLPATVALLPIVESAYQDNALSPKGAQGAWQMMPQTATELGLMPNLRVDFIPETQAALTYLNQLHHQFGSWELAFAAYNAGNAKVSSAIQKNPFANNIDELSLPQETKNYVHKIESINALLSNNSNE